MRHLSWRYGLDLKNSVSSLTDEVMACLRYLEKQSKMAFFETEDFPTLSTLP
jgi:hypothetical protein